MGFVDSVAQIRLDRDDWYGPGRAAQAHLYKVSATSSVLSEDMPFSDGLRQACQDSYYGGWFEIPMHGHVGTAYEYDICSAYPAVIRNLPCLLHGVWSEGVGDTVPDSRFTLVYAEWRGSDPYIGGMPHRNFAGNICRPHRGRGWYWLGELVASASARLIDEIAVERWVSYEACSCPSPFNDPVMGVEKLYAERIRVDKGSAQGKALKLVYNSMYGKLAQSVGNPKFGNPFYASFITSGTRVMILHAIGTHPEGSSGVAMVATDGVFFRSEHPGLRVGDELGMWELKPVKENLTMMMPGVYWDDVTRTIVADTSTPEYDKVYKMKSRGVSARDVAKVLTRLDDQWTDFRGWPNITLDVDFHLTSGKVALSRGKWDLAGMVRTDTTRELSANPQSKRVAEPVFDGDVIRTPVKSLGHALDTVPYKKAFGWADAQELEESGRQDNELESYDDWVDFFTHGVVPD